MLTCVCWYVAYPLSYSQVDELLEERGVIVDQSTINRWVLRYSPQIEAAFHRRRRPVCLSWWMDETYIRIRDRWRDLDRAVDKAGQAIDFLIAARRDCAAALRFLVEAIRRHGGPETITVDGREANASAIRGDHEAHGTTILIRQVRDLKNVVVQDHRAVKRITHPMLGFKSFEAAHRMLVGIELMRMRRKGQLEDGVEQGQMSAEPFYALAAYPSPSKALCLITQNLRHIWTRPRRQGTSRQHVNRYRCAHIFGL
jgi:putative transposase